MMLELLLALACTFAAVIVGVAIFDLLAHR